MATVGVQPRSVSRWARAGSISLRNAVKPWRPLTLAWLVEEPKSASGLPQEARAK